MNLYQGRDEKSFERSICSPCNKYIIVLGKDGNIILLSMVTKQWIANLKMNTGVAAVAFSTVDSKDILWSLGVDGTVYQWDLESKICFHKFADQGSIRGSALHVSQDGKWMAVGSSSGVVNLYDVESVLASTLPEPKRVIMNLTTSISTILFHPSSDLLVIASKEVKDALKIIHIPTLRVVKNWPTSATPLGYVFSVSFSPDGQYIVVGNDKGKGILYRISAFGTI